MAFMLTICDDKLPQSALTYAAFRIAFWDSMERVALADQIGLGRSQPFGFLTEVPFLRNTAPHVQLDVLLDTWQRHFDQQPCEASLLDESVVYACCETSARIIEREPLVAQRFLKGGPLQIRRAIDRSLAKSVQALHLNLSNEGDFLLISQFQDMPPDEARDMKEKFGLNEDYLQPMFDVLGRWHASSAFPDNAIGLLSGDEISRVLMLLRLDDRLGKLLP